MRHTTWTIEGFCYNVHQFLQSSWEVAMKIVGCSPDSFRVFLVLFCLSLAAQDTNGLQPRQLYYKSKTAVEAEQKPPDQKTPDQKTTGSSKNTKSTSTVRHRLKTTTASTTEPNPLGLKYTVEQ